MKICEKVNDRLFFYCPGCNLTHQILVEGNHKWDWCGDLEKPCIKPSILVKGTKPLTNMEVEKLLIGLHIDIEATRCHLFVEHGKLRYLDDCSHKYAGKTIDMVPWSFSDVVRACVTTTSKN